MDGKIEATNIWAIDDDCFCKVSVMLNTDDPDPNKRIAHRFWLKDAVKIDSHTVVGTIDSHVNINGLTVGDRVMFTCDNVIEPFAHP